MIKPLAIYLPQYHPIPENDAAWGEGYTEWTNVKKAKPLFEGHYQPHIPHDDVGYYDLRDPEVLVKQAAMAKEYGIYGFAFYHYWFNSKRLLNLPLDNMLKLGKPDFPFCYIWANEPWSRRWDGSEHEIIQAQTHSLEDDLNHIRFLCEHVFSDQRYIQINGKPMFIVYRTELFPDIKQTATIWREEVRRYGFKDLFLLRVESHRKGINPLEIGFDASMDFPDFSMCASKMIHNGGWTTMEYGQNIVNQILYETRSYPKFRTVFPCWDNSPRRKHKGTIFINDNIGLFEFALREAIDDTKQKFESVQQFFFINAWNEWGEGCHIEPDHKNGYGYLETISKVLNDEMLQDQNDYSGFLKHNFKIIKFMLESHHNLKKESDILKSMANTRRHRLVERLYMIYRNFKKCLKFQS